VSDGSRERGSPFLVAAKDGGAWLSCLEWEAGAGDRIVVRELDPRGAVARTIVVQAAPAEIVRPVAALDGSGRLHLFWTELVDGAPQLRFARLEGESFTAPRTLTTGPGPNRNVEAALHSDGRIWLAWESFVAPADARAGSSRGSIDVAVAPLDGDALGTPRMNFDTGRRSDVDPVVASGGGKLHVAWSAFAGHDYEIFLQSFDPKSEKPATPLDVSADGSSDDLHPSLVATPDGDLWVAWDRIEDSTRGWSLPETLRPPPRSEQHGVYVMAARVRARKVEMPAAPDGWPSGAVAGSPRFSWMGGVPRLALGGDGRPWIAYRYLFRTEGRNSKSGEPVLVQRFGDAGWSPPLEIDESVSHAEEPALAPSGAGAVCAGQQDRRLEIGSAMWNGSNAPAAMRAALVQLDVDLGTWFGPTGIFVACVAPELAPPGDGTTSPAAFVERPDHRAQRHFHPAGEQLDDPILTGEQHLQVRRGEQLFHVYWGDLHRHSAISRCSRGFEPMPTQRYEFGRDVHLYDFMAMTDHAGQIDPFSWWQLDKMCWLFKSPDFCPLAGFECSTRRFGHQNVILDGRITPLVAFSTQMDSPQKMREAGLELLYGRLTPDRAIAIPHTSADTGRRVPFDQCDPKFVKLVEVYQALRGGCEFEGCLRQSLLANAFGSFAQDAMDEGLKVGFVASTDHGNGAAYAGVLAERLDPHSLFTALKERRTFGSTTKGLFVDLRVDTALMGEEVACASPPKIHVKAIARAEIAEVVVFRDGRPWRAIGRPPPTGDSAIGITLVFDPPFQTQPPRNPWKLELALDGGEWLAWPGGRKLPLPNDEKGGFAADGKAARFLIPAGFTGFGLGELRVRLRSRRDAKLSLQSMGTNKVVTLDELLAEPFAGRSFGQTFTLTAHERFDEPVDLTKGLGVRDLDHEWTDDELPPGSAWYYARVVQRDGEICWSSPVFVSRR